MLVALWLCDWKFWKRTSEGKIIDLQDAQVHPRYPKAEFLWYTLFLISIAGAVLSAIGGTCKGSRFQDAFPSFYC